jgi:uncharacterized ion transporter superfamily protein YfcC
VSKLGQAPWILIAGTLVIFGLGAFTIGMGEEYVPLIPILVTMSLAMKLDSIVAMGMIWVPYGIGWACAGTNPFGVVIAQGIAGVPITSGLATRWVLLFLFLAVGFQHVYAYARKIQKDPSLSLVADVDYSTGFEAPKDVEITWQRVLILAIFVAGIVLFVYGAKQYGWYIFELDAIFLGIGLLAAVISRMGLNDTARTFIRGAAEMQGTDHRHHHQRDRRHPRGKRALCLGCRHARRADDLQLLHPVGKRPGLRHHADHVSARHPHRRATAGRRARLPVR